LAKDRRFLKNTFRPLTEDAASAVVYTQEVVFPVGTWLSLVEHSLGVRGVGSSNLPVPTIKINYLQDSPPASASLNRNNWTLIDGGEEAVRVTLSASPPCDATGLGCATPTPAN
jgi:hypothetical protein